MANGLAIKIKANPIIKPFPTAVFNVSPDTNNPKVINIVICDNHVSVCWNFDMDLRGPSLDWYDSGEITTLSKNTAYSIFIGLIVSFSRAALIISS